MKLRSIVLGLVLLNSACIKSGNKSGANTVPAEESDNAEDESNPKKNAAENPPPLGVSSAFDTFREAVLSLSNLEQMEALLAQVDEKWESYPNDVKFATALLPIIRPFRGFAYRNKIFVGRESKITQVAVVDALQNLATSQITYWETLPFQIGFDYFTVPGKSSTNFNSIADVQGFLAASVLPKMEKAISRLETLKGATDIVIDRQILYGPMSFQDGLARYQRIKPGLVHETIADLHIAMHNILLFCAYNRNDTFKIQTDQSKKIGYNLAWEKINLDVLHGFPMADKVALYSNYRNYLTLVNPGYVKSAYTHLRAYATERQQQFKTLHWINKEDKQNSELGLKNLVAVIQGPASIRSGITGKVLETNIPAFYNDPPHDLKAFFPTSFTKTEFLPPQDGGAKDVRNYRWGSGTAWNHNVYRPYFTNIDDFPGSMKEVTRTLSQTLGLQDINSAVAPFVL